MITDFHKNDGVKTYKKPSKPWGGKKVKGFQGSLKGDPDPAAIKKFEDLLKAGWSVPYATINSGLGETYFRRLRASDPAFAAMVEQYKTPPKKQWGT